MADFKPMLASPAVDYVFPLYVSVKIDGIRAIRLPGKGLVSRHIKPIPNRFIRTVLENIEGIEYCDGEILTYTNGIMDDFNTVQSKVMTASGTPDFKWFIFDHVQNPDWPYSDRHALLPQGGFHEKVRVVVQHAVNDQKAIDIIENYALNDGWEGLIARSIDGRYKYGRSTAREGLLLKVVRKQRAEAVIVDAKERMHNENEAQISELGYTFRSSHKDNKVGRGDLGSFELEWDGICDGVLHPGLSKDVKLPIRFSCGTGFSDDLRQAYWDRIQLFVEKGQKVVFEFRGVGTENRPRFPAFIGLYSE